MRGGRSDLQPSQLSLKRCNGRGRRLQRIARSVRLCHCFLRPFCLRLQLGFQLFHLGSIICP